MKESELAAIIKGLAPVIAGEMDRRIADATKALEENFDARTAALEHRLSQIEDVATAP